MTRVVRRISCRTARTSTPITAGQTGETPTSEATPNPATTSPTTTTATTGTGGTVVTGSPAGFASSARNSHRRTTNSTATATSHGASIRPVKCRNDSPVAAKASRLVRFDTGSSRDAEFAR